MRLGFPLAFALLMPIQDALAHKEWVHQYQVKQAYLLLRSQLGLQDIPVMANHIGLNSSGPGQGTWQDANVVIGAWREDIDDPVWNVGGANFGLECGFTASSTHFWDADAGDNSTINIPWDLNMCPLPGGEIPNAYSKAIRYYYGGWLLGYVVSPWLRVQKPNGDWLRLIPLVPPGPVYLWYENLAEVYRTKRLHTDVYGLAGMYNETRNRYEWYDGYVIVDNQLIDKFVWEILGRIAHLVGDMSVPAHAHNDVHPCWIHINYGLGTVHIENGDIYENYMGGSTSGSDYYCNQVVAPVQAYNWTWQVASTQGGFINVVGKHNPLRYLMYSTNQIADHFGSMNITDAPAFDRRWYPGDNNYNPNHGSDNYDELQVLITLLGPAITNEADFQNSLQATSAYSFLFSMRTIAGLFYWFAMETDLLQNSHVRNSFGGGTVRLNGATFASGYRAPAWGSPSAVALEAIDQVFGNENRWFARWRKLVNGTEVQSWTTRQITVVPTANTTYEAVFAIVAPVISGFTQTPVPIYRPGSGTVTCNLSQGNGNITYAWTANYVPSSVYVSFSGNRAYIDNGYFRPAGSQTPAKAGGDAGEPTNPEGLFMLTCTASNSAGSSTSSFHPFLDYGPPPPPPGGCPFVYAWKDSGYAVDNNILPQSQLPENEGRDVTDYYQMFVSPSLEEDKYVLAVGEFENEHSFLDQTKLLVIDHDPDVFITVDDSGTVIQFAKPAIFADAQLDSTDVLKYLEKLDGVNVEAAKDETMSLSFTRDGGTYEEGLLLVGQVPVKEAVAGRIKSRSKEQSITFSNFRLRRNMSYTWVLVPTADTSTVQIDIEWNQDAAIDYSELSKKLELPFTLQEAPLLVADHSSLGDVTGNLLSWDETYTELMPQEWVRLEFQAPPVSQGSKRSFVFVSRGRYVSLDASRPSLSKGSEPGATTAAMVQSIRTLPSDFSVSQNYPNPFNPTTVIKYQLPKDSYVTLKLYDILGREIKVLVDGMTEAGFHEVSCDASQLASGTYIYRMQAGSFIETKKLLLLR